MSQPFLKIEGMKRSFRRPATRPDRCSRDIHFGIERGEFVCMIGHSGCGKTTILNILAGLDEATAGTSSWTAAKCAAPVARPRRGVPEPRADALDERAGQRRLCGRIRGRTGRAKRSRAALKYLELVGLGQAIDKKPAELSGGMKQRVGIARASRSSPRCCCWTSRSARSMR
jgi:nitrate/nitrite transport system ATP-binding protein